MRLILASASPRRAELLRAAGFEFETLPVDLDERIAPGEGPEAHVRRLAREKARMGFARAGGRNLNGNGDGTVLVGADTVVVADGTIFGKPRDDLDAESMLRRLSGRAHQVLTGVCVLSGDSEESQVETTTVEFAPLSECDLRWYVESGEGRDKAGAYAIQGLASRFVTRISGSYSNVVGLPVAVVHELVSKIASRRR